jgi:hypothetical protein
MGRPEIYHIDHKLSLEKLDWLIKVGKIKRVRQKFVVYFHWVMDENGFKCKNTPAKEAGITDSKWTLKELLKFRCFKTSTVEKWTTKLFITENGHEILRITCTNK